jgi:hypothetical protein
MASRSAGGDYRKNGDLGISTSFTFAVSRFTIARPHMSGPLPIADSRLPAADLTFHPPAGGPFYDTQILRMKKPHFNEMGLVIYLIADFKLSNRFTNQCSSFA